MVRWLGDLIGRYTGLRAVIGEHCETNTTGNLLKHAGLGISEPMLYGLGEGLAFGVLVFKSGAFPGFEGEMPFLFNTRF